jgi:DNA gyrase subunit A
LQKGETVVGMVVADADRTMLSICEYGYGKRTPFGFIEADDAVISDDIADDVETDAPDEVAEAAADGDEESSAGSNMKYRRQRRGGKGLRDIKTTKRNGQVVDVLSVIESDEVLMVTSRGKIQRIRAADISTIGRNTQGVRVIRLDDGDTLVSCAVIPAEACADQAGDTTAEVAAAGSSVAAGNTDAATAGSPEATAADMTDDTPPEPTTDAAEDSGEES